MSNFNEFIEYCLSFYGPNGLYDQGRTREQVAYATLMYLDACNDMITWGDGDSLDRERVRDILLEEYNYKYVPDQSQLTGNMSNMKWVSQYA